VVGNTRASERAAEKRPHVQDLWSDHRLLHLRHIVGGRPLPVPLSADASMVPSPHRVLSGRLSNGTIRSRDLTRIIHTKLALPRQPDECF
jgi:hypothetical protein